MNLQHIRVVVDDRDYTWKSGDPVDDLAAVVVFLNRFLDKPTSVAIDPQPQLKQLPEE